MHLSYALPCVLPTYLTVPQDTPNLLQILPAVIAAVERGGAFLAAECARPGGRRGNGTQVEVDLSQRVLSVGSMVRVSAAAGNKPQTNRELCAPGDLYPMPSVAYRLARVAAGDGVCGISLYPVSAHDVVAAHALLKGARGMLVDQDAQPIEYKTALGMMKVCKWCLGGVPRACTELANRDWAKVFQETAR